VAPRVEPALDAPRGGDLVFARDHDVVHEGTHPQADVLELGREGEVDGLAISPSR
jgi:hypothetical protein